VRFKSKVSGLPDFYYHNLPKQGEMYQNFQMSKTYTKWPKNIPNGLKIYQDFPFRGPPKYTQIGIFGLKIYHLATLYVATF
jgi:hypothetical protein